MKFVQRLRTCFKGCWIWYRSLSSTKPVYAMLLVLLTGIIIWGGFNTALRFTNNESFCISCHEMRDYVYQEYKETIHYSNRTGVRATCPDCHVPREWGYMVARKISATNELFHKIIGTIDTPEKFANKRIQLSQHVWDTMRNTDSRECKNCHAFTYMKLDNQKQSSQAAHQRALENNQTCIDCHMGIAHKISKDFDKDGELHKKFKTEQRVCADCHKGMAQSFDW